MPTRRVSRETGTRKHLHRHYADGVRLRFRSLLGIAPRWALLSPLQWANCPSHTVTSRLDPAEDFRRRLWPCQDARHNVSLGNCATELGYSMYIPSRCTLATRQVCPLHFQIPSDSGREGERNTSVDEKMDLGQDVLQCQAFEGFEMEDLCGQKLRTDT